MSGGTPKLFGVSAQAAQAAQASMSFTLKVPAAPYPVNVRTSSKGELFESWTELATIEGAYLDSSQKGDTMFVVKAKIRTGYPSAGRPVTAWHVIDFDCVGVDETDDNRGKISMSNRSIVALNQLFGATGFASPDGSLDVATLSAAFPNGKDNAGASPLKGKQVMVNLTNSDDKGDRAKPGDRRTGLEGYLPAPTA